VEESSLYYHIRKELSMAEEVRIKDMQLSLIWAATAIELVSGQNLSGELGMSMGHSFQYQTLFNQVKATGKDGLMPWGIQCPWPDPKGHHFWAYYLEREPGKADGKVAWSKLVPFRVRPGTKFALTIEASWLTKPSYVRFEVFLYPYGLAVCATVRCAGDFTLEQASELIEKVRTSKDYKLRANDGKVRSLSLDAIANEYLSTVSEQALGPEANAVLTAKDPFTLFTVVKATGVDPTADFEAGGKVHALLDYVTIWGKRAPKDLAKIDEAKLTIQKTPLGEPGDIMYGLKRARAIWFPRRFTRTIGKYPSLSCYHRNLIYATVHVESLCGLMQTTAEMLDAGETVDSLPLNHRQCAHQAAGALGRLYGGRKSYRSYSIRAQIEQSGYVNDIDKVRVAFKMPALSAT
jgi:hypothetical protein